jgi:hypothetical protein
VIAKRPVPVFIYPQKPPVNKSSKFTVEEAFSWLSWINYILEKRDKQLVGNNSYHQIRAMLLNMAEWDETLRSKIGVMNHIQQAHEFHVPLLPRFWPPCGREIISI